MSPALERDRIERWCALHNATLGELHEELDQSGANPNRPLLQRVLSRIENGETVTSVESGPTGAWIWAVRLNEDADGCRPPRRA